MHLLSQCESDLGTLISAPGERRCGAMRVLVQSFFYAAARALQWGICNNMAAGCSILNANVPTELEQPG